MPHGSTGVWVRVRRVSHPMHCKCTCMRLCVLAVSRNGRLSTCRADLSVEKIRTMSKFPMPISVALILLTDRQPLTHVQNAQYLPPRIARQLTSDYVCICAFIPVSVNDEVRYTFTCQMYLLKLWRIFRLLIEWRWNGNAGTQSISISFPVSPLPPLSVGSIDFTVREVIR